jgi:hypothetical protein
MYSVTPDGCTLSSTAKPTWFSVIPVPEACENIREKLFPPSADSQYFLFTLSFVMRNTHPCACGIMLLVLLVKYAPP